MPRAVRALLLIAGIAVLVALVLRTGPATIATMLRAVGWGFLIVSAVYTAHLAVRAGAWWRCMPDGLLRYRDVLLIRFAGEAIEMLTFTGPFLAEPAKGYLLVRRGMAGADAFGAVAIEYLLYTLVSAWMAGVALSLLLARNLLPLPLRVPAIGIVAAMVAFTIGCAAAAISGRGIIAPIAGACLRVFSRSRAAGVVLKVGEVERVLVGFMHQRPARLAEVLSIEAGGHALLVAEVWIVLWSIGLRLAALDPFLVEGGQKFINAAFFFVPGQVGASEGVYALLVASLGYPAAAGLTLALVRRVRGLIVAGAGVAVLAIANRGTDSPNATTKPRKHE